MTLSREHSLKTRFRTLYPEYANRLNGLTGDEFNTVHNQLIEEAKANLAKSMKEAGLTLDIPAENIDQTCCMVLSADQYNKLISATGDDIKNQLHVILDGVERLKGMEKDEAGLVTAQILLSGALSIGILSTSSVIAKLIEGAVEAVAAFAGVTTATVGVVCAIVALVVVAVLIPIIYFMQKPANCIVLVINETEHELLFDCDYNVHGKPTLITSPLKPCVVIPGVSKYPVAGFFATEKVSNALYGTQYGFTLDCGSTGTKISFGVECPLTSIYEDNNCYCSFSDNAEQAANNTADKNVQFFEDSKNGIKASIRCHSGAGSIAYYIARVYK